MPLTVHPMAGVRTRREILNIPAAQLAHELGMEVQTLYRYERGERRMYLDRALRLAARLGCTVEQLSQQPTIEERLTAMRAAETALAQANQPAPETTEAPATNPDDEMLPVKDQYGNTVGYQPRRPQQPTTKVTIADGGGFVVKTSPAPHQPITDEDPAMAEALAMLREADVANRPKPQVAPRSADDDLPDIGNYTDEDD